MRDWAMTPIELLFSTGSDQADSILGGEIIYPSLDVINALHELARRDSDDLDMQQAAAEFAARIQATLA
jgi:hypothetical protein